MIGGRGTSAGFRRTPPLVCTLKKQGQRFLTSLAAADELSPTATAGILRKFAASSSKHVALTTLSHLLSPSNAHTRLSFLAFPLYTVIKQESWFSWSAKLVPDVIAFLYKGEKFDEAENLFVEAVSELGLKERDLCLFYCNLVDSHAKHKSEIGFFDSCTKLRNLIMRSSSVFTKQRGFSAMSAGFCEIGYPDEAEKVVEEMAENGLKPSAFELRSLVYGYGQKGLLEDMKRSLVRMEKEGFGLDTVCCNMVLSSFGGYNELLEMVAWLKKMKDSGIPFSIRTYNSVLNSCPSIVYLLTLSVDELMANLEADEAGLLAELLKSSILDEVMEWSSSELKMDLHGMHLSTAYLVLLQWFDEMRVRFGAGNCAIPAEVVMVCGRGKHSSARKESPVKDLVKEIIVKMKCPLRIDRKNIGCFIAKGLVA